MNILPLLILFYNDADICQIIDILWEFIGLLKLDREIVKNKMIIFKRNYITIQNIIRALY